MTEDLAAEATRWILFPDKILPVDTLWRRALQDEGSVRYLPRRVRKTVEHFETFLRQYPTLFFVENEQVCLYDPELTIARENAVEYFQEILKNYDENPNYMKFRGHIGQADDDVLDFINDFYPGKQFKDFLISCSDVFIVFDDDTVSLIEDESVDYFENVIKEYGEGQHYMNLRGHIGQAPDHVIDYINNEYPGENFLDFLTENDDVFDVDLADTVYLS